jgi:hypothetical protein
MSLPDQDWRHLKAVHSAALDRYCARILDEATEVIGEQTVSPHERYVRLFRLVQERNDTVAAAFDDLRRSTAIQRLAAMISLNVVSDAELNAFSLSTWESATTLADLWQANKKRQPVSRPSRTIP